MPYILLSTPYLVKSIGDGLDIANGFSVFEDGFVYGNYW
jgi:hypothetical protein